MDFKLVFQKLLNILRAFLYSFLTFSPYHLFEKNKKPIQDKRLISVNFHFTRKCNYSCGFCFHTAKTSSITPLEDAKIGLKKLQERGMKKLNFSGGEPFLYPEYLGELCKFAKEELKLESVSIVSNGSKITKKFFTLYGPYVDILAISVDSFDESTNLKIGRGKGSHLLVLKSITKWCEKSGVMFKLNTVVNRYNFEENFSANISILAPVRWKCFQALAVQTENSGKNALRDVSEFLISDKEFETFCQNHEHLGKIFVPESNFLMKSSYIILNEKMCFLNKGDIYSESPSILEVGVEEAMKNIDFDQEAFIDRRGIFEWSREKSIDF